MHVLLFGPVPPPFGGVQTHLMGLRAFLRSQGVRVSIIHTTRHRQAEGDGIYYPTSAAALLARSASLRPDIQHVHLGGQLGARTVGLCAALSLLPHARTVVTVHSGGYPSSPEALAARKFSFTGMALRRCDAVIGVNAAIVDVFARLGVPPQRRHMIEPHAGDTIVSRAEDNLIPAAVADFVQRHSPLLLGVGLLEPEYQFDHQMKALGTIRQTHPNAGLLIIGSGTLAGSLAQHAAALPEAHAILVAGDVAHEATLALIRRADAMLRTTTYDGDSLSVREALTLGTPVIATDTGMRPTGVVLLADTSRDAIARAVRDVAGRRMAPARAAASSGYGEIVELYRALLPPA